MIRISRVVAALAAALAAALLAGCVESTPPFAGDELYADHCAVCHGVFGDGEGPAAAAIAQTVPDLRQIALANDGRFPRELVRRIVDGREIVAAHRSEVMPRWGEQFQLAEGGSAAARRRVDAKITALVDYLERIQLAE